MASSQHSLEMFSSDEDDLGGKAEIRDKPSNPKPKRKYTKKTPTPKNSDHEFNSPKKTPVKRPRSRTEPERARFLEDESIEDDEILDSSDEERRDVATVILDFLERSEKRKNAKKRQRK